MTPKQDVRRFGGRPARALAIDPSNSLIIYADAFKTTNGGDSWQLVNAGLPNSTVLSLAIDPINPSTVYVGSNGAGVFKSLNGGTTWQPVNNGFTTGLSINTVIVDPINVQTVFAASFFRQTSPTSFSFFGAGIFKSLNGGTSWQTANSGLPNVFVNTLTVNPVNPSIIYAGLSGGNGFSNAGVHKSLNGGDSWQPANIGLSDQTVLSLAVSPANPNILNAGTNGGGVFKSTDGGASWQAVNTGLTNLVVRTMAIEPANPGTVYAGTDGGGVFKITFSADIAAKTPVLLVHGWCGSPSESTWGQMLPLLQSSGLNGDYARFLLTDSIDNLERLADLLRSEIRRVLNNPDLNPLGSQQVDVVAHSMGGLVTRAWIAGLAKTQTGRSVPYGNNIRRLVTIGTPNYGVPFQAIETAIPACLPKKISRSQAKDMEFGSDFLLQTSQELGECAVRTAE